MNKNKVIAIRLVPTSYKPKSMNVVQLSDCPIIGTLFSDIEEISLLRFRVRLEGNVKTPKHFVFLNSYGWPINPLWESDLLTTTCVESNVVTIWPQPELKKIGIKLFKGSVLGFIQVDIDSELKDVRRKIMSELPDKFEDNETFRFMEGHNWPLTKGQEEAMSLWDIDVCTHSCITIQKVHTSDVKSSKIKEEHPKLAGELPREDLIILISYSIHDGGDYAKELLKSLHLLGLNGAFLGRLEPFEGNPIDKATNSVKKCEIFIPLITRFYTKDPYSKREVTLAKKKKKLIIPISFVENWIFDLITEDFESHIPFITWKIFKDFNGEYYKEPDWTWNQVSIKRVSEEIREAIVKYYQVTN